MTWQTDILSGINAPTSANNISKLTAWNQEEGNDPLPTGSGLPINNPFNTTRNCCGGVDFGQSAGVKAYPDWSSGLQATIQTLNLSAYSAILSNLVNDGSLEDFANAVGASPWGTSGAGIASILGVSYSGVAPTQPGIDTPPTTPTGGGGGGSTSTNTVIGNGNPQGQQLSSAQQKQQQSQISASVALIKTLSDPDSNLPFTWDFQAYPAVRGTGAKLVRGGMVELQAQRFKLYFMMNPQQIASSYNIDQSNITSPTSQAASNLQYGTFWLTNNSISFTLYFNRMYEVWRGDVFGPGGKPGPSALGVRWDIRALERLIGVYDAQAGSADYGLGVNGPGNYPPSSYPVQVVFGGPASYRFQGTITSIDYTYTLFSKDMIPIEGYADIGIMRIYNPSMSSPQLAGSLTFSAGSPNSSIYLQPSQSPSTPANAPAGSKNTTFNSPPPKKKSSIVSGAR